MPDVIDQHHIRELEHSMQYWNARAGDLEERAAQMRFLAHQLRIENQPFRTIFDPIRHLHTTTTWQGRSGLLSRRRLDIHEDRCLAEVRRIDHLIDDLEHGAAVSTMSAESARVTHDGLGRDVRAKYVRLAAERLRVNDSSVLAELD